jgi:hypothetical protein
MIRKTLAAAVAVLVLTLVMAPAARAMKHGEGGMKMHHLHMLMNHGLGMATEGATLVMIAGMKMSPSLDASTLRHGRGMLEMGRVTIERAMSGPEMMAMMKGAQADSPGMRYTHRLGEAMMKAADILAKMETGASQSQSMMDMHHMHILLAHALQMAAEGGNMVMLGRMGMAGDVDDYSVKHGKAMLESARAAVAEVMDGEAMKKRHGAGMAMDNPMMKTTHQLAEVTLKIISLLSDMPAG